MNPTDHTALQSVLCKVFNKAALLRQRGLYVPAWMVGNQWSLKISRGHDGSARVTKIEETFTAETAERFLDEASLWLVPSDERMRNARFARSRVRRQNQGVLA